MEPVTTKCPYCQGDILVPDGAWILTCNACGNRLDLHGHFAFLRGLAVFEEGQALMQDINPKKQRIAYSPQEDEALKRFMEAYSSLQVAFQFDLAEVQRSVGVEMMTSMATEFMKRNMVSGMEANYWNSVMVEQTLQDEIDQIKTRLSGPTGGLSLFRKLRWRYRSKQLRKALAQIEGKITALESQIAFLEIPRARRRNWK